MPGLDPAAAAAAFDHALAAVAGRAAVITVTAGDVVKISSQGQRWRPRGIADDGTSLA